MSTHHVHYTLPGLEYEKSLISEFFLKEHLGMPSEEKYFLDIDFTL